MDTSRAESKPSGAAASSGGRRRGCRTINAFEPMGTLGGGTYGKVQLMRDKQSRELVAVKQVVFAAFEGKDGTSRYYERVGLPRMAITELRTLEHLAHYAGDKPVIRLREVVTGPRLEESKKRGISDGSSYGEVYMVMDYAKYTLSHVLRMKKLTRLQVRCYMRQMLEGLTYMHALQILHRDLKGENVFVTEDNLIKIGDFGMSRRLPVPDADGKPRPLTSGNDRVTLWYRPPEIVLGDRYYGPAADIWACGLLFLELMRGGRPVMQPVGASASHLMRRIYDLIGVPDTESWPELKSLDSWQGYAPKGSHREEYAKRTPFQGLNNEFKEECKVFPEEMALVRKMLALNPKDRISARAALALFPKEDGDASRLPRLNLPPPSKEIRDAIRRDEELLNRERLTHEKSASKSAPRVSLDRSDAHSASRSSVGRDTVASGTTATGGGGRGGGGGGGGGVKLPPAPYGPSTSKMDSGIGGGFLVDADVDRRRRRKAKDRLSQSKSRGPSASAGSKRSRSQSIEPLPLPQKQEPLPQKQEPITTTEPLPATTTTTIPAQPVQDHLQHHPIPSGPRGNGKLDVGRQKRRRVDQSAETAVTAPRLSQSAAHSPP